MTSAPATDAIRAATRPASNRQLLSGATCVFADGEGRCDLLIEDGRIAALDPESSGDAELQRLDGMLLLPGLIDLHCDAIERHLEPRPGAFFPAELAFLTNDRLNAACGITTIYHALTFADGEAGLRTGAGSASVVRQRARMANDLLVDHRMHARYEVSDASSMPYLETLLGEGLIDLVSIMDHSPGQGQFRDDEAYIAYQMGHNGASRVRAEQLIASKRAGRAAAAGRIRQLAAWCQSHGVALASHDVDDPARVAADGELGVCIAEFPINLLTAQAAVAAGQTTLFGAPNVLRGGSQSGNMRALDAIRAGACTALCADYAPQAILPAVLRLAETGELDRPRAVGLVSAAPAAAAGLQDRGRIAIGLRADLLAVELRHGMPVVQALWSAGRQVLAMRHPGGGHG